MIRLRAFSVLTALLGLFSPSPSFGSEPAAPAPDFMEVYDLLRAHLTGVEPADLNRAAVHALVTALAPKVSLQSQAGEAKAADQPLLIKSSVFEGPIAYFRIGSVGDHLSKVLNDSYNELAATNHFKGLVLDLRYAGGLDYNEVPAVADLFSRKEQALLDWGQGMTRSRENAEAISLPVAVLVNGQTSAAAEAIAAVLREIGAGLILGNRTAGGAMITQEFPLKDGQQLRIATAPIHLGNGSTLPAKGIEPDITVDVPAEDERSYFADAFLVLPKTNVTAGAQLSATNVPAGTNRTARRNRFNEAELVRERKEGTLGDSGPPSRKESEPDVPVVHDPALARALDLLKGLAVVRQAHS